MNLESPQRSEDGTVSATTATLTIISPSIHPSPPQEETPYADLYGHLFLTFIYGLITTVNTPKQSNFALL